MSMTSDVTSKTRDRVDELKETVADTAAGIKQEYDNQVSNFESAIRRNPLTAAGIAAGVGFLVAAVIARR